MPTAIITPDLDAVVGEVEIAAPPERVFQALTDRNQLAQWWNSEQCKMQIWEMDARPGGKWRFEASDPTGKMKVNGVSDFKAHGEIIEFDPPRLLVYTWIANWHERPAVPASVRWELTPTATGTRVKVTHSGLAQESVARKDYSGGWIGVLDQLRKHCE